MSAYRIGQAAQLSGVSAANIRYYEREGLVQPRGRADNDYRFYTAADVHRLRFIRMCRAMDMSLDEVRTLLALDGSRPEDCRAASDTVHAHLEHVRARMAELQQLEAMLQALKGQCDGAQPQCNLIAALHAQADGQLPEPISGHSKRHV